MCEATHVPWLQGCYSVVDSLYLTVNGDLNVEWKVNMMSNLMGWDFGCG